MTAMAIATIHPITARATGTRRSCARSHRRASCAFSSCQIAARSRSATCRVPRLLNSACHARRSSLAGLGRVGLLVPFKSVPRGSQAPYLFLKLVGFFIEPRHLGLGRLIVAQFFASFAYRE